MPAVALSVEDEYFSNRVEAAYPPAPVETIKSLVADAALKLVYDKTPERLPPHGQCLPKYREVLPTSSHRAVPFVSQNPTKGVEMSSSSVGRKLPSTSKGITKAYTAERVSFALQAWGKERASPIKVLARLTGVSRKAAEAWWHGKNPPQSDHLFTLARQIPELKSEVARLLELEQDQAESFQREAIALLQRYSR
jgi:transcriptional regulator with XRE-family HTH domain